MDNIDGEIIRNQLFFYPTVTAIQVKKVEVTSKDESNVSKRGRGRGRIRGRRILAQMVDGNGANSNGKRVHRSADKVVSVAGKNQVKP